MGDLLKAETTPRCTCSPSTPTFGTHLRLGDHHGEQLITHLLVASSTPRGLSCDCPSPSVGAQGGGGGRSCSRAICVRHRSANEGDALGLGRPEPDGARWRIRIRRLRVARGGVEPPTFRFSVRIFAQVRGREHTVRAIHVQHQRSDRRPAPRGHGGLCAPSDCQRAWGRGPRRNCLVLEEAGDTMAAECRGRVCLRGSAPTCGPWPPLLMASGLTSEHKNPTGRWWTMPEKYVAPFAEHFHRTGQPPAGPRGDCRHCRHGSRLRGGHRGRPR